MSTYSSVGGGISGIKHRRNIKRIHADMRRRQRWIITHPYDIPKDELVEYNKWKEFREFLKTLGL
jgi:hypothetical protein